MPPDMPRNHPSAFAADRSHEASELDTLLRYLAGKLVTAGSYAALGDASLDREVYSDLKSGATPYPFVTRHRTKRTGHDVLCGSLDRKQSGRQQRHQQCFFHGIPQSQYLNHDSLRFTSSLSQLQYCNPAFMGEDDPTLSSPFALA